MVLGPFSTTAWTTKTITLTSHTHSIERIKCEWCGCLHVVNNDRTKCSQCGAPMQGEVIYIGSR